MNELWTLYQRLVEAAPVVTLLAIYIIYRVLMNVRVNDLAHIDEKIDSHHQSIMDTLAAFGNRVQRTEDRLDGLFDAGVISEGRHDRGERRLDRLEG